MKSECCTCMLKLRCVVKVKFATVYLTRQRKYLEMSPYLYRKITVFIFCSLHWLWKASFYFGRTNYVYIFLHLLFTDAVGCYNYIMSVVDNSWNNTGRVKTKYSVGNPSQCQCVQRNFQGQFARRIFPL
jgi:hypothetical protein